MNLLETVISFVSPAECLACGEEGQPLCDPCRYSEIIPYGEHCFACGSRSPTCRTCPKCRKSSPSHVWVATDYMDTGRDMVRALKFGHQREMAKPIARSMAYALNKFTELSEEYILVPIPTATSRVRQRSFDHTVLISQNLSKLTGLPTINLLKRLGQSRQVGAKRGTRAKQATGVYYVSSKNIQRRKILLIDDVVTTGATLRSATKVLRSAGASKVDALVFAKKV